MKYVFMCPVCNGKFYIRGPPPKRVNCPHCSSILYIECNGRINILKRGTIPFPPPGARAITGAIGGALLGLAIAGPIGGFLGFLLGGALGKAAEEQEAEEV